MWLGGKSGPDGPSLAISIKALLLLLLLLVLLLDYSIHSKLTNSAASCSFSTSNISTEDQDLENTFLCF